MDEAGLHRPHFWPPSFSNDLIPEVPPAQGSMGLTHQRRCDRRWLVGEILGKPEYSTLPRLDIPAANTPSLNHSQSSRAQVKIESHHQLKRTTKAACFPTTQPLPNFKLPWPLRVEKRNRGTTGPLRWIRSALWSLANSNNQQRWRKMWINHSKLSENQQ